MLLHEFCISAECYVSQSSFLLFKTFLLDSKTLQYNFQAKHFILNICYLWSHYVIV
jgi:uncharacterized membrane protein YhhN